MWMCRFLTKLENKGFCFALCRASTIIDRSIEQFGTPKKAVDSAVHRKYCCRNRKRLHFQPLPDGKLCVFIIIHSISSNKNFPNFSNLAAVHLQSAHWSNNLSLLCHRDASAGSKLAPWQDSGCWPFWKMWTLKASASSPTLTPPAIITLTTNSSI